MMRAKILTAAAALALPLGLPAQAGAAEPVTLTGMTWFDENFDGIRQDTEGALWKWPVRVEEADGPGIVARGETGVGGRYSFTDLPPGRYQIVMGATPERWPTLPDVGEDRTDSDIDQMHGKSPVLDCTGGPCAVVDGGFAESHLDVALDVSPDRINLPPRGRETVRVDLTNTGTRPWRAPVYLPPQGVTVENPHGAGWHCTTVDPQRPNCTPTESSLLPGESRPLWFDVAATEAPSGNVDVSVLEDYDDNPANNHGLVDITVG